MRGGRHLVLNIAKMVPRFSDYDIKDVCPMKDHFFSRQQTETNVRDWIRPSEDIDIHGNKGYFSCHPKYNMIILSDMTSPDCDDEIIQMVRNQVPHMDEFHKVYIKPEFN